MGLKLRAALGFLYQYPFRGRLIALIALDMTPDIGVILFLIAPIYISKDPVYNHQPGFI